MKNGGLEGDGLLPAAESWASWAQEQARIGGEVRTSRRELCICVAEVVLALWESKNECGLLCKWMLVTHPKLKDSEPPELRGCAELVFPFWSYVPVPSF